MVGAALRAVVVPLLLLLLLLEDSSIAFIFPGERRGARTPAWSASYHVRARWAGGGGSLDSQERMVEPSQPGLQPGASHLWSAASYYPRWPDHIHQAFRGSVAAQKLSMREARQATRPPLVQARHQRNNPYRQTEDTQESLQQRRRPLSTSLWYWT